jgi:hypothetical protein
MESKQSRREYEKQWREPFPEREMIDLTKRVKELRRETTLRAPEPRERISYDAVSVLDCAGINGRPGDTIVRRRYPKKVGDERWKKSR